MKNVFVILLVLIYGVTFGQKAADTSTLKEVVVKAYFSDRPLLKVPASISVISNSTLRDNAPFSLVPAVNTIPGVRMEERSPGSYRFSIRGSLLRSPFGVRNVKIYFDDFMLTDAAGNSYLNLIDPGAASTIEVIKGPEGSIYGANTGGVVLIRPKLRGDSSKTEMTVGAGSFGTFRESLSFNGQKRKFKIGISEGYVSSAGYRQQSNLSRAYVHLSPEWNYSPVATLKSLIFFSDLTYQTPGGLTLAQFKTSPDSARRQAITQRAEVSNRTFMAGLSNEINVSKSLKHVLALTASTTGFQNPAVANYELRDEHSEGFRTYLQYTALTNFPITLQTGIEGQRTAMTKRNFVNNAGSKGAQQQGADLNAWQSFAFVHLSMSPLKSLTVETAASINYYNYNFQSLFPESEAILIRKFKKEVMPRLALSYQPLDGLVFRTSISRGFSPPSLEEVNPSGSSINKDINAEKGWSREFGVRVSLLGNRVYWDAVFFNYQLKDAIVRGVGQNEVDYYINAGGTSQKGFESEISAQLVTWDRSRLLRSLQLKNCLTFNHFRFEDYVFNRNGLKDYSGNKLTGVPAQTVITSLKATLPLNTSLFVQHNFTSEIPLNDANAVSADAYHLLNIRLDWLSMLKKYSVGVYFGVDNVLNARYSLGNDLNAAGDRYFNAAPGRNYYLGLTFGL